MADPRHSEYQLTRVPLVGVFNIREFDVIDDQSSGVVGLGIVGKMIVGAQGTLTRDQQFTNCIPTKLDNPFTKTPTFYLIKRPGFVEHSEPKSSSTGKYITYWGNRSTTAVVSAFADTNSEIFVDTTSIGSITGEAIFIFEVTLATVPAIIIQSSNNTLWYHVEGMLATIVGDTNTNATIDSIPDTSLMFVGQAISGTDIPSDTRILTIVNSTSITIDKNATGTTADVTFTLEELATVDDTDYPGNNSKTIQPGCVFMNGFLYVMDSTGTIHNSDLNTFTSWSADGSIETQQYPDNGISIIRYRNLVAGFNSKSLEFFSDIGNPSGTPLLANAQSTIKIGAASKNGISSVEDILTWVSSTDRGGSAVYIYDNYQAKKISTPVIEQQIAFFGAAAARVNVVRFFGRFFILVKLSSNTYVYSIEDQMWHEWSAAEDYWDVTTVAYAGLNHIYSISVSSTAGAVGKVWAIKADNIKYTDDGSNYMMTIQTSKFDLNNDSRKRLTRLKVIGDTKINSEDIDISWSDDDYSTFSTPRTVDISDVYKVLNNCGTFRRRAFKLTYTGNVGLRLEAMEFNTTQANN